MDIDRPRQGNPVDGQLLVVDTIGSQAGQRRPEQRDHTDDDTQPEHSFTLRSRVGGGENEASNNRVCNSSNAHLREVIEASR
ncbi:hypothetical protein ACVILH_002322 [Bradyrhizobium sp. USDA 4353]